MKKIILTIFLICMAAFTHAQTQPSQGQRAFERSAVQAAIWGMPIVSFDAMRQAFFRDAGAKYGDIVYLSKPADWKFRVTTPNSASYYVYTNFNVKDGPVVIDFPAAVGAGLFGSILDAWQAPLGDVGPAGEDKGNGGKYLILPPDFKGKVPTGYFVLHSSTYNGYALFRVIPKTHSEEDTAKGMDLIKKLRVYALSEATNPPSETFIDISGRIFDGIAKYDNTFYDSLARMVNEEPVQMRDLIGMGQLRAIGIEKGKEFKPDDTKKQSLNNAIVEAQTYFMYMNMNLIPFWPTANWGKSTYLVTGAKTAFTFQTDTYLDINGRGALYFIACAPPKKLGAASVYLTATKDSSNTPLMGGNSYQLHVPADVPAGQFWSVTVYDLETGAFIYKSPKTDINSYQNLQKNTDGSVDVFFGPRAPDGKESNWIFTAPGKIWITFFRIYGPGKAIYDKTWTLPSIELK